MAGSCSWSRLWLSRRGNTGSFCSLPLSLQPTFLLVGLDFGLDALLRVDIILFLLLLLGSFLHSLFLLQFLLRILRLFVGFSPDFL